MIAGAILSLVSLAAPADDAGMALPVPLPNPPAAPTAAAPPALAVADLERIAIERSPSIFQAAERIEQARGNVDQAGRYPNPFAVWDSQSIGAGGTMGAQGSFVQQPIVTGGKIRINRSRYEIDVEIARWNLVVQHYRVLNGVRLRANQILREQRLLQASAALVEMAREVVDVVGEKVDTGHASEADLLAAEDVADRMDLDLEQLRIRYLYSWRDLAAYIGMPGLPPTRLVGDFERGGTPYDWESTLAWVLAESPEIKVAALRVLRAEWNLKREQVEPIPDLILRGGAAYDPANDDMLTIVRVYIDLPFWDRNQGNIYTAEHALLDIRHELDRVRLSVEQRLARRINQHLTSEANVRRYRETILPRARRTLELYLKDFRGEEESYSRVQSSLVAYADASIKYLQELQELRNTEAAIAGFLLIEDTVQAGTPRPLGRGVPRAPVGGGAPVGGNPAPTRTPG